MIKVRRATVVEPFILFCCLFKERGYTNDELHVMLGDRICRNVVKKRNITLFPEYKCDPGALTQEAYVVGMRKIFTPAFARLSISEVVI